MSGWDVLNHYGFPMVALLVVLLAFKQWFWPTFTNEIKQNREFLAKQLGDSQARYDRSTEEFMGSLEKRDLAMRQGFELLKDEFAHIHRRLDNVPGVSKDKGKRGRL